MCALIVSGTQLPRVTCFLGTAVATLGAVPVAVSVAVAVLVDGALCHSFCVSLSELTVSEPTPVALGHRGHCHPVMTALPLDAHLLC